jgi:hypothetical protein
MAPPGPFDREAPLLLQLGYTAKRHAQNWNETDALIISTLASHSPTSRFSSSLPPFVFIVLADDDT